MRFAAGSIAVVAALAFAAPASAATISVDILSDDVLPDGNCSLREAVTAANTNAANTNDCPDGESAAVDVISLDASGTYQLSKPGLENANAGGDLDFTAADAGVRIEGDPGFLGLPADTIDGGDIDRVIDFLAGAEGTVASVQVRDGSTASVGGGIAADGDVEVAITDGSVVTSNEAGFGGGGIAKGTSEPLTIEDSAITQNTVPITALGASGGGVSSAAPLFVVRSVISQNTVTISGNSTSELLGGGGISLSDSGQITDSTISGNTLATADPANDTRRGGGIELRGGGLLTMRGSTINNNSAGSSGSDALGGGVMINSGNLSVVNSTFTSNGAAQGGALHAAAGSAGAFVAFTTFGANAAGTGSAINAGAAVSFSRSVFDQGANACAGFIDTGTYNLDRGSSCVGASPSNFPNFNPLLSPLAFHGGPTQTSALGAGMDLIPESACLDLFGSGPLTVDQRGFPRPFPAGGGCDPGAYELFTCDGVAQNPPGPFPFSGCPQPPGTTPPAEAETPPSTQPPGSQPPVAKKCKKKKHKRSAGATKKRCKKRKPRR